jgi:pyridoxamine 5'-phosphate oxidase
MDDTLKHSRRDFKKGVLLESDVPKNPLDLLMKWYLEAVDQGVPDANAMGLSTLDLEGFPVSRIVLLRDLTKNTSSQSGLNFFTNYESAKGHEIQSCPKGGALFFWQPLERQVRVRGLLEKISAEESDAYFATRPRESQIGAWASPQSQKVGSRDDLEGRVATFTERFKSLATIPRPDHWGGYKLVPDVVEFWQGRPSRLHDRLLATLRGADWVWERLAP